MQEALLRELKDFGRGMAGAVIFGTPFLVIISAAATPGLFGYVGYQPSPARTLRS